ncbi:MAG: helix-hairpin-helix domain-containing protein [Vicingaceae bacterium]
MNNLKDYFYFTSSERKGIFVLVLIIIGLIVFRFIYKPFNNFKPDYTDFEKQIKSFEAALKEKNNPPKNQSTLFLFNPNHTKDHQWEQLGLKPNTIKTIKNYLQKVDTFSIKSDLLKVYGIDSIWFKKVYNYIDLPDSIQKHSINFSLTNSKKPPETKSINLNKATPEELQKLKGIGKVLSQRIVKYRDVLGGFYTIQQLKEVYGLNESTFHLIKNDIFVQPNEIQKLNLNKENISKLKQHPYISFGLAKAIINYRTKAGAYKNLEDLKKLHLMNDSIYNKMLPYIEIK